MVYGVIYVITCLINSKKYVGQTTQPLKRRINQHKRGEQYIDRVIKEYGWENFKVEVIEECANREQLNVREKFWICELNCKSPNGYNLTDGGEYMQGLQLTPESIAKAVETRKETLARKSPEELRQMTANARAVAMARTQEERGLASKKAWANRTLEERSAILKKSWTTRKANDAAKTQEDRDADAKRRSESAKRGNQKRTSEERSASVRKGRANMSAEARCVMAQKTFIKRRAETPFKNLLAEIDKRQFTYSSLAKLVGLNRKSISLKMRGKIKFTDKDIAKLVEIFKLPAEYLMKRED